jgi:hypothetical protein
MKKLLVFAVVLMLVMAGCQPGASDGEVETQQTGSVPMTDAPIYKLDGNLVSTELEGDLYLGMIENSFMKFPRVAVVFQAAD